ncbi:hypothetical protein SNEBB_003203 [Seison nebaliae]|nr:hypothetical protein SNEBB_003203 [Seison nebaliae]
MTLVERNEIKRLLKLKNVEVVRQWSMGGVFDNCILKTDIGKLFVKKSNNYTAPKILHAEKESLDALIQTELFRVPNVHLVFENFGNCYIVMEYLEDLKSLSIGNHRIFGRQLALLHKHNWDLMDAKDDRAVLRYGFHTDTACGTLMQNNEWGDNWVRFYEKKLKQVTDYILIKDKHAHLQQLINKLTKILPNYFGDYKNLGKSIKPSLLHGDLWSGNVGTVGNEISLYDAACLYGHHEFDLGIGYMFGPNSPAMISAYFEVIQKMPMFEKRKPLYEVFHHLNHWAHFGRQYEIDSISLLERLIANA